MQDARLSVRTGALPLAEVLRAIANAAEVSVTVKGDLGTVRAQEFDGLAIADGLRRLIGDDHALLMVYRPHPDGGRVLEEVRVYGTGWLQDETGNGMVPAPSGPRRRLPREAETALAMYLYGDDDAGRAAAAKRLEASSEDAVPALTAALDDPQAEVRLRALRALQTLDGAEVLNRLSQVARADPEPALRQAAIYMLGGFTSGEVRRTLQAALADPDEQVRQAAAQTLSQLRAR